MVLHEINVSVQFVVIYVIERDILLVGDTEKDMRTERNVFFSETSQHHNVVLQHTHTNTHTHTHDWPTMASGQVVPEEFFRVLQKNFGPKSGQQEFFFWPPGGHGTSENIFLRVYKMFRLFMYVFVCRHYAATFKVVGNCYV